MYDYTEQEGFKLRCIDHEVTFAGLKDYQMLLTIGSLALCLSNMIMGLFAVVSVICFFRWTNRMAFMQKHVTLTRPVLWLCWKIKPLSLVLPHLNGVRETQKVYRN